MSSSRYSIFQHIRKHGTRKNGTALASLICVIFFFDTASAQAAKTTSIHSVQRLTELKIRNLIEPVLEKYCPDQCKLMSVSTEVDLAVQDELSPGFADEELATANELEASSGRIKLLMDDKIGPVSRSKLLELVQQFLDTLDFPVKVETQIAHFPQPVGSAGKVADIREKITKQFKGTIDDLFRQFCPEHCLMADYALSTDVVNSEESQYGASGEFVEDGGVAVRIRNLTAKILVDETLSAAEQQNILEMAKLRTNFLKNVDLTLKSMKFPRPEALARGNGGSGNGRYPAGSGNFQNSDSKSQSETTSSLNSNSNSNSTSTNVRNETNRANSEVSNSTNSTNSNNETNARQERFERFEKIERVENGDAVQQELQKFKVYGLVFAAAIIGLLVFISLSSMKPRGAGGPSVQRVIQSLVTDPVSAAAPSTAGHSGPDPQAFTGDEKAALVARRYEIEHLRAELINLFAEQPKVARHVFSRILTEEGVETTSAYIHIFGESVVLDMLKDPSLQGDMAELMEFHSKNPTDLTDEDKLELLRKLHNKAIAGKLFVMGSRSTQLFEFLTDMDGLQILEMLKNESITVKAIVMTQCDLQKRSLIFNNIDQTARMKLLDELSRIDYLPRDYIHNVAAALKRKRRENPRLNTEALPGSDVLLTLLERSDSTMARTVMKNLESGNPDTARMIKGRLVTLETLQFLKDSHLLEVVLSLKHDELLTFLKGAPAEVKNTIYAKSPKDLVAEIEEELEHTQALSKDAYSAIERKVLNRIKMMSNDGLINLVDVNERMLMNASTSEFGALAANDSTKTSSTIKKVAGW
jgi:flagellar motor switch protein FliG